MTFKAVVVGAGGGIGRAVAEALCLRGADAVHTISRHDSFSGTAHTQHWQTDHSPESMARVAEAIDGSPGTLERLVICLGVLQGSGIRPERALRQLDSEAASHVFEVNTILPMQWLASFQGALKNAARPRIAVLSARVGSIADNRLGGWYSYRASKAALNMMLQCASIEFARLNKAAQLMAYHPGTVDTPLSEPFQRGVAPDKLFTPEFTATRLLQLLDDVSSTGTLAYVDWDGKTIPF